MDSRRRSILAGALCLLGLSCASWRTVSEHEQWKLCAESGQAVDEQAFARAFDPALRTVASAFGPFRERVCVHVVADEKGASSSAASSLAQPESLATQDVPGIGLARVRAWHVRSTGPFGAASGIYLGTPDTGTAAHELVHARLAELAGDLPLWLEEGLASIFGDGILIDGTWTVDGLACWPLRELGEQQLSDEELARLCRLRAGEDSDSRENVLAHFVGWAIVFDLLRESGSLDWNAWLARYSGGIATSEARERLQRTLAPATVEAWLAHLRDPRPEVRAATAKGLWKLRSERVLEQLLDALTDEQESEVRVVFSINALAAAGEMPLRPDLAARVWRTVWPKLRRLELQDSAENSAFAELKRSFRYGSRGASQGPLEALRRVWAE
jgi:HEAT repeats